MKKRIFQFTAIFILSLFTITSFAQDRRTLDTKIADALAQMPANDLVHRDKIMNELLELGPEGFEKISDQLTPAGQGDDTAIRFAINGLTRFVSDSGNEGALKQVESGLLAALEKNTDTEVRTFLLNQLNQAGTDNAVDAVKKYIGSKGLTEPVVQTLVSIGSEKAADAILENFASADENGKLILTQALGNLKCTKAVETITGLTGSSSQNLRKAALEALSEIGSPKSYKLLMKAAKDVGYKYEMTNAAPAFIAYAGRLAENGETKLSRKAFKKIFKANQSDENLHNYTTALSLYTKHFSAEAMPLLLKAAESSNKEFRNGALNIVKDVSGGAVTKMWINRAGTVSEESRTEIIDMLGHRGDKLATVFVSGNLNDSSPEVRETAIEALTRLEGKDAVPVLLNHIEKGNDTEAVKQAFLQIVEQKQLKPLADRMKTLSGESKSALIDVIAAKSGNDYFNDILALTNSSNPAEKASAFNALKNISTEKNLDALIHLLLNVDNENEIQLVQQGIITAAQGVDTEKTENGKLLQALNTTGKKERILPVLPEIGGDAALKTITEYFNSSSGNLKETAFKALTAWKDYSAAASLYEVAENSTGTYRSQAFSNFARQVRTANLPDDQKLLQYRKIMPFASNADDRKQIITAIGNLKTFLSLIYLEQYLGNKDLQQTAARAIMKIAMPDSNGKNGFAGDIPRKLLERVASVITGEESDYDIININNYLAQMPEGEGFVSMFDGKTLDGWQGMLLDGSPIKIAKMTDAQRAKAQEEANKKMVENWSVRDGKIVFNGRGANLVSVKKYRDFEMIVDWKITREGDSGIYLRGTPQVQIWDTALVKVGAQVGSGGLYNNNPDNIRDPLKVADNPVDEWNTFRITMTGENVTVYLNGELVVDNVKMDNFWDRSIPIFEEGTIELQAHGNELEFRDIYVKEIKTEEIGLTEEEKTDGFVSVFNGINLSGWQGNTTDYFAENGELVVKPSRGGHGNLYTDREYSDFVIRFEFQLTPGANNGLGVRAPLTGDAAYEGMELQILDNTAPIYAKLAEYQYHGSVYGVIAAKRGFLKPVGEWNEQEALVQGTRVKITLNGTVILDGDIAEASKNGTLDGRDHPGLKRTSGYIGFLGHGDELKFRNIRIKDLSK